MSKFLVSILMTLFISFEASAFADHQYTPVLFDTQMELTVNFKELKEQKLISKYENKEWCLDVKVRGKLNVIFTCFLGEDQRTFYVMDDLKGINKAEDIYNDEVEIILYKNKQSLFRSKNMQLGKFLVKDGGLSNDFIKVKFEANPFVPIF